MMMNPATQEQTLVRKCAMVWVPELLVENSRQQNSTGAAIESFRNAMARDNLAIGNHIAKALTNEPG